MSDLLLLAVLIVAVIIGWRLGTIQVLANLGSLVIAYQLARVYSATLAAQITARYTTLDPGGAEGELMNIIALLIDLDAVANRVVQILLFIVIFIVVNWLIRKLAALLTGLFRGGLLGSINRAVGAFLALALGAVLIVMVHSVVLPAFLGLGFGHEVAAFLNASDTVLPLLYAVPLLI